MADDEKKEVKDSNELLNIFMIIIGAIFIFQGINFYFPQLFGWLPAEAMAIFDGTGDGTAAFKALLGANALMQFVLGIWCFIAGIGMFQEQEWAWGMSLVLLSVIIVTTGGNIITSFVNWTQSNLTSIPFWISFVAVAFSALGILWLLGTKDRYA